MPNYMTARTMAALEEDVARLDISQEEPDTKVALLGANAGVVEAKTNKDIFPFFKLPRELRDRIYAEATTDIWTRVRRPRRVGVAEHLRCALLDCAPCVRLALVNRQFKREYEEEMSRKPGRSTLTMELHHMEDPRDPDSSMPDDLESTNPLWDDSSPSLRLALSGVRYVILTHEYQKVPEFGFTDPPAKRLNSCTGLERHIWVLPSLEHIHLVFHGDMAQFQERDEIPYSPRVIQPINMRRLMSLSFSAGPLDNAVRMSCSVALSDDRFIAQGLWSDYPSFEAGCYDGMDTKRKLYHGPASLDPLEMDKSVLEIDEVESRSVEDVEEYAKQHQLLKEVPGHVPRIWTAGYRTKFQP